MICTRRALCNSVFASLFLDTVVKYIMVRNAHLHGAPPLGALLRKWHIRNYLKKG